MEYVFLTWFCVAGAICAATMAAMVIAPVVAIAREWREKDGN